MCIRDSNRGKVEINGSALSNDITTTVAPGVQVSIQAVPNSGFYFTGWSDLQNILPNTTDNPIISYPVYQNSTVYASFDPLPPGVSPSPQVSPAVYPLNITTDGTPGASAFIRIGRIDYSSGSFPPGTYNLYATPVPAGYVFSSWTGATVGNQYNSTTTIQITNAPVNVQANFAPIPSPTPSPSLPGYTITANSSPTIGGSVNINGGSLGSSESATVSPGVQATIQAYPANSSLQFNGWIDPSGVLPNLTDNPIITNPLYQSATVTATFGSIPPGVSPTPAPSTQPTYLVTVNTDGTPGASAYIKIGNILYSSVYLANGTYNLLTTQSPTGYTFSCLLYTSPSPRD